MKFQFSFQKVMDVKEKDKEMAEVEYGTVRRQQIELKEKLEGLGHTKNHLFKQYNVVDKKTVSELLELQQEMDYVTRQMENLEVHSRQLHQEVEKKHHVLVEKTKEAKMWTQWKAKSKEAFQKQLLQKEQAFMDEMAVLRFSRRI